MATYPMFGSPVYQVCTNKDKQGRDVPVSINVVRFSYSLLECYGKTVLSTEKEAQEHMDAVMQKIQESRQQEKKEQAKKRNEHPSVKKNCFAYQETSSGEASCMALIELYCKRENCNFYKRKRGSR